MRFPLDWFKNPYTGVTVRLTRMNMSLGFGYGLPYDDVFASAIGIKNHNGHDWPIDDGEPVYACHSGIVTKIIEEVVGVSGTRGIGVTVLSQTPKNNKLLKTVYWHLKSTAVKTGDIVSEGQLLGEGDNTGFSTGPHLHFGAAWRENGIDTWFDPLLLFKKQMPEIFTADNKRMYVVMENLLGTRVRYWVLDPQTLSRGEGLWGVSATQDPSVLNLPYGGAIFISNTDDPR